jgi:hypothetical protein
MPIVVTHNPDIGLLARAGYVAGYGEFLQRQQELAQRERMQERALAANMYSQQIAQNAAMERMLVGGQMEADQRAWAMEQEINARRQLAELEAQNRLDVLQQRMERDRQNKLLERETAGNADIVKFFTNRAAQQIDDVNGLLAEGYQFEGDGEKQWRDTMQQIARLQQDQTLSPMAAAQAIYNKMAEATLPRLKPPALQDTIPARIAKIDTPDGPVWVSQARDLSTIYTPHPKKDIQTPPAQMSYAEWINSNPAVWNQAVKMATEVLTVQPEKYTEMKNDEKIEHFHPGKKPTPDEIADAATKILRRMWEQVPREVSPTAPLVEGSVRRYDVHTGQLSTP